MEKELMSEIKVITLFVLPLCLFFVMPLLALQKDMQEYNGIDIFVFGKICD